MLIHTYTHTCMCTYKHTHTCVHTNIHIHTYMQHACIQTYIHAYIRTHTHTYFQSRQISVPRCFSFPTATKLIHTYIHTSQPTSVARRFSFPTATKLSSLLLPASKGMISLLRYIHLRIHRYTGMYRCTEIDRSCHYRI
jgi:hypothetical protein